MRFASILSLDWTAGAGILSRDDSPSFPSAPSQAYPLVFSPKPNPLRGPGACSEGIQEVPEPT